MADKQEPSTARTIFACIIALGIFAGGAYVVKSFLAFNAEQNLKEDAEFTATFNVPIGDTLERDTFELRQRIVNSRLHVWALELDKKEKELDAARRAIFEGTGSNYQQDLQVVKIRRAAVDQVEAVVAAKNKELEDNIILANHGGYYAIQSIEAAIRYQPGEDTSGKELFAWFEFIAASFVTYFFALFAL